MVEMHVSQDDVLNPLAGDAQGREGREQAGNRAAGPGVHKRSAAVANQEKTGGQTGPDEAGVDRVDPVGVGSDLRRLHEKGAFALTALFVEPGVVQRFSRCVLAEPPAQGDQPDRNEDQGGTAPGQDTEPQGHDRSHCEIHGEDHAGGEQGRDQHEIDAPRRSRSIRRSWPVGRRSARRPVASRGPFGARLPTGASPVRGFPADILRPIVPGGADRMISWRFPRGAHDMPARPSEAGRDRCRGDRDSRRPFLPRTGGDRAEHRVLPAELSPARTGAAGPTRLAPGDPTVRIVKEPACRCAAP